MIMADGPFEQLALDPRFLESLVRRSLVTG